MKDESRNSYEDMICLPHHVSTRHPQMPLSDRAAQFAPFAALKGYDAAIREAARPAEDSPVMPEREWEEWPEDSDP